MKKRNIPVYLEGRFIENVPDSHRSVHAMYERWWRIYGVKKVYRVPGKAIHMENKYRPPLEIK